jgi:hypothetical protein
VAFERGLVDVVRWYRDSGALVQALERARVTRLPHHRSRRDGGRDLQRALAGRNTTTALGHRYAS